ncbi:N-acetylmuramoyl-L-alanine amidase family 2 (plasmid) [Rhodothermus marinus DSM 4252]|uniref:N-acetylmuramoyl-L-alanine amidase family 2 n=2 Tax=Rhodothermus marinus TaxID=29549 RepID=D0MKL9_RHOM4|nr:N-acetylmuramoyl-L-alanine amidase family 2 [Rhodothermus marinus DSM 4252]
MAMRMPRRLLLLALLVLVPVARAQQRSDVVERPVRIQTPALKKEGGHTVWEARSDTLPGPFTGIILRGTTRPGATLRGWIRLGDRDDWHELTILRQQRSAIFWAGYRSDSLLHAPFFRVRFEGEGAGVLQIIEAGTFNHLDDSLQGALKWHIVPGRPSGHIRAPHLIRRSEWGARPFIGTPTPQPYYDYETFHHTAGFAPRTYEEGIQEVRNIQQFHQDVRGWSDIGYHFLLDLEGRIYQGRPFADESIPFDQGPPLVIGAHVGGHNTGNIGVAIMGCFHPPEGSHCIDQLTPAARDSLVLLLAYLIDTYGIDPLHILGHREWPSASTACPGDNNMALLPAIREEVAELLKRGTTRPAELVAEVSVDADGVVRLRWNVVTLRNASRLAIVRQAGVRADTIYQTTELASGEFADVTAPASAQLVYQFVVFSDTGYPFVLAEDTVQLPHYADWLRVAVFPSPFVEEARLRYYLRTTAWVEADLFDVLGRPVRRLIRGYVTSGWHGVSFALRGAATGMYYVRFRASLIGNREFVRVIPVVYVGGL